MAAANRRKQDDKNLEILRELISLDGNKYCFDCKQRGPTYVNTTIGSFVCSKCSGMLRGLTPPHRVKSISMATFTPDEIEFIKSRGNEFCRRSWLGLYDGESVNFADEQSVRDFMSDKYEKKRFYLDIPTGATTNGGFSRSKMIQKYSISNNNQVPNNTPLISISPQSSKNHSNNNGISNRNVNNVLPVSKEVNHGLQRPGVTQPVHNSFDIPLSNTAVQAPVPDFPVDFTNAVIYNGSGFETHFNNNSTTIHTAVSAAFSQQNNTSANDRYAALADLDHALRQQNKKTFVPEDVSPNLNTKNPFQCSNSDVFATKNPFFSDSWGGAPATYQANPFTPSANKSNYVNSKNPFL